MVDSVSLSIDMHTNKIKSIASEAFERNIQKCVTCHKNLKLLNSNYIIFVVALFSFAIISNWKTICVYFVQGRRAIIMFAVSLRIWFVSLNPKFKHSIAVQRAMPMVIDFSLNKHRVCASHIVEEACDRQYQLMCFVWIQSAYTAEHDYPFYVFTQNKTKKKM